MKFSALRPGSERLSSAFSASAISILVLSAQLMAERVGPYLRFQREAVLEWELWRLLSCHVIHLGWVHALMNLLAAWLIVGLFQKPPLGWSLAAIACGLGCSLGLLIFEPELAWYVGFSGVLHGLVIVGLFGETWSSTSWLIFGAVVVKIATEQITGGSLTSQFLIGGPVAVDAHLWGAIAGLGWALILRWYSKPPGYNPVALNGTDK